MADLLSKPEPTVLGKLIPLKRNRKGEPLFVEMPHRVELMEIAANELFQELGKYRVQDLKELIIPISYKNLLDALLNVRVLMGGEGSI